MSDRQIIVVLAFLAMFVLLLVFFFGLMLPLFRCWVQLKLARGGGTLFDLIGLRLRGVPVRRVVDAYVMLVQQGRQTSLAEVERVYHDQRHAIRDAQGLVHEVLEEQGRAAEAASAASPVRNGP